jgi:hypothetical protein
VRYPLLNFEQVGDPPNGDLVHPRWTGERKCASMLMHWLRSEPLLSALRA